MRLERLSESEHRAIRKDSVVASDNTAQTSRHSAGPIVDVFEPALQGQLPGQAMGQLRAKLDLSRVQIVAGGVTTILQPVWTLRPEGRAQLADIVDSGEKDEQRPCGIVSARVVSDETLDRLRHHLVPEPTGDISGVEEMLRQSEPFIGIAAELTRLRPNSPDGVVTRNEVHDSACSTALRLLRALARAPTNDGSTRPIRRARPSRPGRFPP